MRPLWETIVHYHLEIGYGHGWARGRHGQLGAWQRGIAPLSHASEPIAMPTMLPNINSLSN